MLSLWSLLLRALLWGEQPHSFSVPRKALNPAVSGWPKPVVMVPAQGNFLDYFLGMSGAHGRTGSWGFHELPEQQLASLCCAGCGELWGST